MYALCMSVYIYDIYMISRKCSNSYLYIIILNYYFYSQFILQETLSYNKKKYYWFNLLHGTRVLCYLIYYIIIIIWLKILAES